MNPEYKNFLSTAGQLIIFLTIALFMFCGLIYFIVAQ